MSLAAKRHLGLVILLTLSIAGCATAPQTSSPSTDVERILRTRGFVVGGRPELVAPVNEILVPLDSWDVGHHSTAAPLETGNLGFLLEGVPNLVADQEQQAGVAHYHASTDTLDKVDFGTLRRNATVAVVTVAGIGERADLLARRQSRIEIEALMRANPGLERDMRDTAIWSQWESGQRGRR